MTNSVRTWLAIWCWAVVAFGVVLAGAASEVTDGAARWLLAAQNPSATTMFDATHRYALGLVGAVTIGWGLTLRVAFAAAENASGATWRALTGAMLVWFVIDGAISAATGFALNIVSNTALFAAYLWLVWRGGLLSRP